MMLGDVLAVARRASGSFERWLAATDPELEQQVAETAALRTEPVATFVRGAVSAFERFASEADWSTLTARIQGADDPANACLLTMLRWRLARERSRAVDAEERQ